MIGPLKDMPDYMIGAALAGIGWFGFCYAELAPRALDDELQNDIYPACVAQLEDEQERYVHAEESRLMSEAKRARDKTLKELERQQLKLAQFEQVKGLYDQSGLTDLMRGFGVNVPMSKEQSRTLRRKIRRMKMEMRDLPAITLPRTPSADLMKTCTCAGLQAATGLKTGYAISLASFRVVPPTATETLKTKISNITQTNICGDKPWRAL